MSWRTGQTRGKMGIKCSPSSVMRKSKLILSWDSISPHSRWPSSRKLMTASAGGDVGNGNSYTLLVWMQTCVATVKIICRLLRKLNKGQPRDPAILLLAIYPKDSKSTYHRDPSAVIIAAQFTIPRKWNHQQVKNKKVWYIYVMDLFCDKENSIRTPAQKWISLC